ncbi:MAG: CoxG family protein [Rhodospirillales bacterium]
MQLSASRRIAAPRAAVWAALNDPDVLRRSLAGCERLEPDGEGRFAAWVATRIGPLEARFQGRIVLADVDPPRRCRIIGEGDGGVAGFARGAATVDLEADDDATVLRYDVEATVGGKLAQLGARLVEAAARKIADEFFARFETIVAGGVAIEPPDTETDTDTDTGTGPALPALVWAPALVAVVALVLFLLS